MTAERVLRVSVVGLGTSAILLAVLALGVGGPAWCTEQVAGVWASLSGLPAQYRGRLQARTDFKNGLHQVYCSHFLGWPFGLNLYQGEGAIVGCGISYWRLRPEDPRNMRVVDGPDPYSMPAPPGLPGWADELRCSVAAGGEVRFAVSAIRVSVVPGEAGEPWMPAYNREMVLLLLRGGDPGGSSREP